MIEKEAGLVHRQVQHVVDVLALVPDFHGLGLEALPLAIGAADEDVGHEVHLYLLDAASGAGLAPPPRRVEREMSGAVAHVPRQRGFGEQAPDRVVGFQVRDGVAPGALADGALVEQHDGIELLEALYPLEAADGALAVVEDAREGRIERVMHQRALARAGDPRDRHQTPQGNVEVHFFEIVLLRAQQGKVGAAAVIPALDLSRANLALAAQELRRRRPLAPVEFLPGAGENHLAPALARAGT